MTKKQDESTASEVKEENPTEPENKPDDRKVCGIVMPIAAMGEDYPEAHWSRVLRIIERAIERAGLRPQLVWENPEVDVIQTAILQNIFESDVVICDVSNLNPNVMLETGLRLSTKRPTIIITDKEKRPPFDIGIISYIDYPRNLEFNSIEEFIGKLVKKIKEVVKAVAENKYKPYIEQFRFETVQPDTVTVTTDEYVRERLDDLSVIVRRLVRMQEQSTSQATTAASSSPSGRPRSRYKIIANLSGDFDKDHAEEAERAIDAIAHVFCTMTQRSVNKYDFQIHAISTLVDSNIVIENCKSIIDENEANFLFD